MRTTEASPLPAARAAQPLFEPLRQPWLSKGCAFAVRIAELTLCCRLLRCSRCTDRCIADPCDSSMDLRASMVAILTG